MESISEQVITRLFAKRHIAANGCWLWQGCTSSGYGTLDDGTKTEYTHRLSWKHHKGEIPKGLYVCHSCDTPHCFNPEHLFLGTSKENIADCIMKGHPFGRRTKHRRTAIEQVIRLLSLKVPQRTIRDMTGVSQATISEINRGVRKYAK